MADKMDDGALRGGAGGEAVTARRPNFFVVGAGRCGTTSIQQFLAQHPDVYVPERKSPNFYASHVGQPSWETPPAVRMSRHWITDPDEYGRLYAAARDENAVGDVSPVYLQAIDCARAIHSAHPDARIIAILRDPADRARAHFLGRQRDGIETKATFDEWVDAALDRPMPDDVAFGHYVACGRYHHFLNPYIELFGTARVLVLFYEDLMAEPRRMMRKIFGFLGVDEGFGPDVSARLNVSGVVANPLKRMLWTSTVGVRTAMRPYLPAAIRRGVGTVFLSSLQKPDQSPSTRKRIIEVLHDDIVALERMTGRDLTAWRT